MFLDCLETKQYALYTLALGQSRSSASDTLTPKQTTYRRTFSGILKGTLCYCCCCWGRGGGDLFVGKVLCVGCFGGTELHVCIGCHI